MGYYISLSGMRASQTAMEVSAHNTANMNTQIFNADKAVRKTLSPSGVEVTVEKTKSPTNIINEMVTQISERVSFEANAQALNMQRKAQDSLLDIYV